MGKINALSAFRKDALITLPTYASAAEAFIGIDTNNAHGKAHGVDCEDQLNDLNRVTHSDLATLIGAPNCSWPCNLVWGFRGSLFEGVGRTDEYLA